MLESSKNNWSTEECWDEIVSVGINANCFNQHLLPSLKRVKKLEVDLLNSQQYSRRECIEIDGIPKSTKDSDLESPFVDILKEIDITVNPITDIQACHKV